MAKGSSFEREFCGLLSRWWTKGALEDCFWRTGGSGGRAKTRGRKGKATYGQHGDVAATHPIGDPFIRAITVELKRGYSRCSIADLLDKRKTSAKQEYEKWFAQAIESHKQAGSLSWMVVTRRDCREAIVLMPKDFLYRILRDGSNLTGPYLTIIAKVEDKPIWISGLRLEDFFAMVDPVTIQTFMHTLCQEKQDDHSDLQARLRA